MKQAFLICLLILFAAKFTNAQNTQVFHNADSTTNRTVKLLNSGKESTLYSLSWHRGTDTTINNGNYFYKLNKIDTSGRLISSRNLFKNGIWTVDITTNIANQNHSLFGQYSDSLSPHYIGIFTDSLSFDSFAIQSSISVAYVHTYIKRNDSLFIISRDDLNGYGKMYLLITDTLGHYLTHKRINYEVMVHGKNGIMLIPLCMIDDENGGFIIGGSRDSTERKQHLFGLDVSGNITWRYIENRIAGSYIKGIQLMPDKTILAYGAYGDFMYLAKFNQQGQLLSENFYYPGGFGDAPTGNCNIINVKIIDGYIYAVGSTHGKLNSLNTTTDLGTLLKLTMDGEPLWAKVFGNYYYFNILDQIYQTADNRLLLAGLVVDSTQQPIRGVSWYVSTDTAANQTLPWCQLIKAERYYPFSGVNEAQIDNSAIHIYPNPTDGNLTIENRLQAKLQSVQFYNTSGVLCYTEEINSNTTQIAIKATHLPQGLYYIKINTPQGQVVKKIIKE